MENKTSLMTVGRVFENNQSGIPVLEVLVDGKTFGWLSPFRGQYFQVSRTIKGEMTLGTSQSYASKGCVLKDYLQDIELFDRRALRDLASVAINNAAGYWYMHYNDDKKDIAVVMPTKETKFIQFIDLSINWVKERA